MMYRGCERSVITYSSLISACEKAGQVGGLLGRRWGCETQACMRLASGESQHRD
jgi:hypothetical protein